MTALILGTTGLIFFGWIVHLSSNRIEIIHSLLQIMFITAVTHAKWAKSSSSINNKLGYDSDSNFINNNYNYDQEASHGEESQVCDCERGRTHKVLFERHVLTLGTLCLLCYMWIQREAKKKPNNQQLPNIT